MAKLANSAGILPSRYANQIFISVKFVQLPNSLGIGPVIELSLKFNTFSSVKSSNSGIRLPLTPLKSNSMYVTWSCPEIFSTVIPYQVDTGSLVFQLVLVHQLAPSVLL